MGLGARMARQQEGFHSAASLIRYFDQEDEKALKIPPLVVVLLCILVSGLIIGLTLAFPVSTPP
jgi:preprotein translocase subunit Sec61beta